MAKKPELFLAGPRIGGPSVEDILALYRRLTGKEPTPEEIERTRAILAKRHSTPRAERPRTATEVDESEASRRHHAKSKKR